MHCFTAISPICKANCGPKIRPFGGTFRAPRTAVWYSYFWFIKPCLNKNKLWVIWGSLMPLPWILWCLMAIFSSLWQKSMGCSVDNFSVPDTTSTSLYIYLGNVLCTCQSEILPLKSLQLVKLSILWCCVRLPLSWFGFLQDVLKGR